MTETHATKRFYNQYETIVQHSIDGLIAGAGVDANGNPRLMRLDGYPHIKVVLRGDWNKEKVAIISGGGAGHEPAHAGFVGKGMLTAAVSGEIFASPTVDAVLEAICSVTGEAGCLLVVKNYTGDRLNFGLAAERAKKRGFKVEMVIVGDDIAIPGSTQPRGVAGTLFVHKYAGYLAEEGVSLARIKTLTETFSRQLYSLGMSLSTCSQPGRDFTERLTGDEAELGLGIHGEPGRDKVPMQSASGLVSIISKQLFESLPADGTRYGLMVNNLGAVPPMEMNLIVNELMSSPLMNRVDYLFGPGHLMTALNMNGFSLSLVALDETSIPALLSEVDPPAWLAGVKPARVKTLELVDLSQANHYLASTDPRIKAVLLKVEREIVKAEAHLNQLDAKVGDGDAGSTFATGARAIAARIEELPMADSAALFGALASFIGKSMGGTSGILLSIFFNATANGIKEGLPIAAAMHKGIEQIQFYGGASQGSRTMLDAMIPALEAYAASGDLEKAALRAEEGAAGTASTTKTSSGRSAYVTEAHLKGVEDPGARAVAIIVKAIADGLK